MRPLIAVLMIVAVCSASCVVTGTAAASPTDERALQTSGTLTLSAERSGDTVVVTVAATGNDIAGYQANVTYDPDVLRFQNASGVDFDDPVTNANDEAGWVFLTESQTNGTTDPVFARLTFRVVGEAGSDTGLGFVNSDSLLNDADAENVETTYETSGVGTLEALDVTETATPGDDTPSDNTPGDDTPGDDTPSDNTPGDDTPSDDTPGDGGPDGDSSGSDPGDDGLVSDTLLLGVGVGLGVAVLLGAGIVLGMRFGSD